ncbi:alpha/beta fold hydrolase [Brevibacillus laterosporus]|uniref:alpha/beta fold hydrolase n=1 Tax=Brevibacillus laterosporus TaxID=1465 RepID=UPI00264A667B|nr:alpha/beta hydrolase [Brevibacillus laterosporus]MDN9011200.1 alpha/beta hydrolase [Brevibacillus laterosporus]MDO0942223.1 alpha/beta hydrolase [Brevibacillus laterosporus]
MSFFEGFREATIKTSGANIFLLYGGSGPPLLLLHGYPQNHVTWHKVAPELMKKYTLIIPDLRGYGRSEGPPPDPEHVNYSKRAMAHDMYEVMNQLGYDKYHVAGHDKGGRVAYTLALDHPEKVTRLSVLEVVPELDTMDLINYQSAHRLYHYFFLSQPLPFPETLISHAPQYFVRNTILSWAADPHAFFPYAMQIYEQEYTKYSVIQAGCEDYRAGITIDYQNEYMARQNNIQIQCPLLFLWGSKGLLNLKDPVSIWKKWAPLTKGAELDSGHFIMEENPSDVIRQFSAFF